MPVKQAKVDEKSTLKFKGNNEDERNVNSVVFDRLTNILERFGKDFTKTELQTIQYVMFERVQDEEKPE